MFHSFTGSSRKARQVNLSGQNASTRKGATTGQRSNAAIPGGQAAIAQAHAQRLQRGQERERVNASRLLQRSWRGYASRQESRRAWRAEWDGKEMARTGSPYAEAKDLLLTGPDGGKEAALAYDSAGQCYLQMRLLLHFLDIKREMDRARLIYFGKALQRTFEAVPSIATEGTWTLQLYRLSTFMVECLDHHSTIESSTTDTAQLASLFSSLLFLARLIPKYMGRDARRYYSVLARLVSQAERLPTSIEQAVGKAVLALLTPITAETLTTYTAFGTEFLTRSETLTRIRADELIAPTLNHTMLTAALNRVLEANEADKTRILNRPDSSLWLLAHLIYLHRHSLGATGSVSVSQETNYIKILSTLLAAQSISIRQRIDLSDPPVETPTRRTLPRSNPAPSSKPLPPFIRTQLLTLVEKSGIIAMMSQIELAKSLEQQQHQQQQQRGSSSSDNHNNSAQTLATYALTLTRVFPGWRADSIRLALYDASAKPQASTGTSAMLYFWASSRSSSVFREISQDPQRAVTLLRSFLGIEATAAVEGVQQREWRTLLLFLELYSFAITHMDDEEFLAGGEFGTVAAGGSTGWGRKIRESSLPLREVGELVGFLKNLAFALYWNSRDLLEGDSGEQAVGLGAYFGTVGSGPARRVPVVEEDAAQESARIQLRDAVTGLLRSIHQRE